MLKYNNIVTAVALCAIVALGITTTTFAFALFPEQRFANGFRDGCNNVKLTGGHHTQEYINGYNKGIRDQGSRCDRSLGSGSAATSSGRLPLLVLVVVEVDHNVESFARE